MIKYSKISIDVLRNYVVSWKYWWDILHFFFSHTECKDDSCQKLWKVV